MKSYFGNGVRFSKLSSQNPPKLSTEGIEPLTEESIPRENLFKKFLLNLMPILFILTGWEIVAQLTIHIKEVPFPTPIITSQRLIQLMTGKLFLQHTLYGHLIASLLRWGTGFILGTISGIILSTFISRSLLWQRIMMPLIYILQLIPGLAWIPIAILLFGIGEASTIFMIFVIALVPVIINMVAGIRNVEEMYVKAAQMMGANSRTIFFQILLPGSLPHLLSGLRVAVASSWRVVIAAEMVVGTGSGLGYSIIQARWNLDYASAFVCIIIICIVGLIIEKLLFERIERLTIQRWGLVSS